MQTETVNKRRGQNAAESRRRNREAKERERRQKCFDVDAVDGEGVGAYELKHYTLDQLIEELSECFRPDADGEGLSGIDLVVTHDYKIVAILRNVGPDVPPAVHKFV